ncbi:salt stress protein, Slr1339 family [Gloeothece verrucosa]|uniref:Uncharacterized protein n=1 Tax=Gloeothece verrucosa (strain PCC 7822) TaxID=497965 RepID=E0UJ61_GLOV7|nr:hypothetical protein [Gloeothece verrucosa]ADN15764.1 hypothetical protein Cyan7822_3832 [Gloeothece verrucosa PCC 7822]
MDEIDALLSELEAEYRQPLPQKSAPNKSSGPLTSPSSKTASPLDDLLAQVKEEVAHGKPPKSSNASSSSKNQPLLNQSREALKNNLIQELHKEDHTDQAACFKSPASIRSGGNSPQNDLLQDLQKEFQEQEKLLAQRQQQEQLEKQRLQEQREQRKKLALTRQATEWLNKLDRKSEEGRWFEEFSYSYDSKLQAAIHYLEALRESGG